MSGKNRIQFLLTEERLIHVMKNTNSAVDILENNKLLKEHSNKIFSTFSFFIIRTYLGHRPTS